MFCFLQVIADDSADPSYVAADLLSQAEHGPDSQVVLVAVNLTDKQLENIQVSYLSHHPSDRYLLVLSDLKLRLGFEEHQPREWHSA